MIQRLICLYMNYKEVVNYLIFGGLTTLVNFIVYFTAKWIGIEEWISNGIAWIIAVSFAYITNKIFVFESKSTSKKEIVKEISSFFGARAFSGILDIGLFWLLVEKLGFNDVIIKIILQIIVILLNYIFSKLWVFRKNK